ncbi:DUF6470 family protein [Kurthia gibsonii]|uniref:DUF6470 family protein n=1 Tax=Kurthia gibsonii TaxID=33946 RepID=UPI002DBE386C|nr:DUF6470 family protein [Kurthia gibsonii]MEB6112864.1 DUF6470 family protein [Kurthia gibsonii]
MKLDQIQLNIQDAKVDLNITQPKQYIEQPRAQQHIEQPAATLEIHHTDAKLLVDSSQAYRDLGLISNGESIRNFAAKGQSAVMEGMARRASEGNAMMEIRKSVGRETISNIAKQHDTFEQQRLGITWKPSVGSVKIKYQEGSLDIRIQAQKPEIDVQLGKVVHDYQSGDVTGTLIQREKVETTVIKGE